MIVRSVGRPDLGYRLYSRDPNKTPKFEQNFNCVGKYYLKAPRPNSNRYKSCTGCSYEVGCNSGARPTRGRPPSRHGPPQPPPETSVTTLPAGETLYRERSAASRRHVDASLDLFTRKSPRTWRHLSEKRALSARRLFLWMVGV